jgi:deoxyribonuclease (pyrimidine dimer)
MKGHMTRINVVNPSELSRQHLVAEYREITRLPGNLNAWINRKSKPPSFDEIPSEYKLGTGHVKFFFNKFKYLEKRVDKLYYNDYNPTEEAIEINRQRIKERSPK